MKIIDEFKKFAVKGNVADMAVGIIIGAAFGKIVSSLVDDIITPPIGLILGGVDFSDLAVTLKEAQGEAAAVTLSYGKFFQACIDFLIVALSIFFVIKLLNQLKSKDEEEPASPPKPSNEELLLAEIRDLLKNNT